LLFIFQITHNNKTKTCISCVKQSSYNKSTTHKHISFIVNFIFLSLFLKIFLSTTHICFYFFCLR